MTSYPTKSDLLATTKLACEIANINADRFNEAVHANFYPCAPKTTPGKARTFDVDDIVALRLYQRSMDAGMSAAAAGEKACKVREFMQANPDASRVYIISTDFKVLDYFLPDWDVKQDLIKINATQAIDVIGFEMIDLDWHRVRAVHYITEADKRRVVGD
ncbi:hypothetical protein [uncultured Paracoccus sp.]|uniref:hypothetical protein n=1 Tax=uncultured Paracoccus sp. TaxID=189685 RepID=UPI00261310AC|nr:hypothetical protein [uncultured Paracoccus sp.]